ncbi:Hsp70 family protein [Candidatus Mycobacterium methanotrophicum]|uniref:Hsp70 family protein n=1 Tax=Candidatus Mycobacterium methanotrophicum TaxID=2943498 RepID=A0ABY4QLB7_9MYCO|nr:Hsp70 family protein [Candidatus Mycobacterium methanotrophicum]UQX10756.1 Hsp70 family protein [Candidatus Mycobacterium methanotrophicum]
MRDVLGLSIGVANLVAARVGRATVTRRSVLTLYPHRPPEVGVAEENPDLTEPGLVLRGFIPGNGESGSLVASDGSVHHRETLMAEALDALARTVGYSDSTVVAVPGHWGQNAVAALRESLLAKPSLETCGMPAMLVSDATAALASLYAEPGFPADGVVVLCDFGAGGTSVTLSDATSNFRHIGETVHYTDFAGDRLDKAILHRLQGAFTEAVDANAANTAPPDLMSRRLDECRQAKERLSSATVTVVPAQLPVTGEEVRLSRQELEDMMSEPLDQFITSVAELLRRNAIPPARLAAVATVGGGACIPLVTKRLEQRLHAPVVTTQQPSLSAATGAAAFAEQQSAASLPTDMAIRPGPTAGAGPPTDIDPSAWAVGAARLAAAESVEDGIESATYRALAWSADDSSGDGPLLYTEEDGGVEPAAPMVAVEPDDRADDTPSPAAASQPGSPPQPAPAPPPRRRRLGTLFALTVMTALTALLVVGVMMSKLSNTHSPTETPSSLPAPKPLPKVGPLPPPPPSTVTVTDTPTVETTVVAPPRYTNRITTSVAPTTTTPRSTSSSPATPGSATPSTFPSTYPTPYPAYPPATTTPTTAQLAPPTLVPVTPYVP